MHDLKNKPARTTVEETVVDATTEHNKAHSAQMPDQADPLTRQLERRQARLERLGNMEDRAEHAHRQVMAGARAEFAALMKQLNGTTDDTHENHNN